MKESLLNIEVVNADCLVALRELEDCSVDAVITDPPYGLSNTKPAQVADVLTAWVTGDDNAVPEGRGFMGKSWDGFVPPPAVWKECMRVLKPGGHMAVFAGARTQDLMGLSIRLAGFEIRDTLGWVYGSGFPKSMDVSKAIDKAAGAEREVVGRYRSPDGWDRAAASNAFGSFHGRDGSEWNKPLTAPASDAAKQWDGWGTALKPAIEPIILARKPLDGTVAANVLAHGVGGLNIDACRVAHDRQSADWVAKWSGHDGHPEGMFGGGIGTQFGGSPAGRFPANVLLDEHAAQEMDEQSGVSPSNARKRKTVEGREGEPSEFLGSKKGTGAGYEVSDSGGASRFFPVFKYQAKAPKRERPVIEREDGTKIQHPTVKPLTLLEWLCALITPPGGTILDPFAGSGTTLEAARNTAFNAIGIEREADYVALINKRLGSQSG